MQLLHKEVGIGHGMLELMASILESDEVHIWLSGFSTVCVKQGVPEGGNVGSLCYNVLPDSLVRKLEAKSLGLGVVEEMPAAWRDHWWQGCGVPCDSLISHLRDRIRGRGCLSSAEVFSAHAVLEASAARALD